MNNRPMELIDNWLTQYGFDKRRSTGDNAMSMCYAYISEWDGANWNSRWRLASANPDLEETIKEAFLDMAHLLTEQGKQRLKDRCVNINALLLMAHGEGAWMLADPETKQPLTWENMSEAQKAEALDGDPNFEQHLKAGVIPVRVVNLVSRDGLAGEVSMFFPNEPEPHIERDEQWVGDDMRDVEPRGRADEVLIETFAFLSFLREVVAEGHEMSPKGLMSVAMKHDDTQLGRAVAKMLLKRYVDDMDLDELREWWSDQERES